MNTVIFKIYINNETNKMIENKTYTFNLNEKIIDIKKKIIKDTFNNSFNNLEMINITDKIYKDYGKLFFDKGLLPSTINNYSLSHFTNEGRIFSFLVKGQNIENKIIDMKDTFLKKMIKDNRKKDTEFKYYEDDFPPLISNKK